MIMEGAATKGVENLRGCFDTNFEQEGYQWEGTCQGTSDVCYEGGYQFECTNMMCTCDCVGVVTQAQIKAIDKKCDASARQKFVATGGSMDEWEVTKQDAQADAGVAMMGTCYMQEFEAQGYQQEGTCKGSTEICYEGGWKMMGGTCDCVGVVTAAQQEAIHTKCDETAKKEYMKSGGDPMTWDMNLMEGAEEAGVEMMTSCFDKKFEAAGSVIRLLLSWLLPQFLPWLLSLLLPVLTLCVPVTFLLWCFCHCWPPATIGKAPARKILRWSVSTRMDGPCTAHNVKRNAKASRPINKLTKFTKSAMKKVAKNLSRGGGTPPNGTCQEIMVPLK